MGAVRRYWLYARRGAARFQGSRVGSQAGSWPGGLLAVLLVAAILPPGLGQGLGWFLERLAVPDLHPPTSALMLDRQDRLLRPFTVDDGRWRLPVALDAVDPGYLAMLTAVEDRRFREHAGVDPLALVRAAWQWLSQGHIVSGGSTLSMQLARLLEGRGTRSLSGKLSQILTALALERRFDKNAILRAYLTLAPYGGNIEGVRAASLAWFGKEPRRLSAAESALLVALPQAPEARRPDRDPDAARRARDRILARVHDLGLIDRIALSAALREPVPTRRRPFPVHAAHLTWHEHRAHPDLATQRLAIDLDLQSGLERLAEEAARRLGPKVSMAILVVDHRNGDVVAAVGSADPFDDGRRGYIDMTRALRSPGSTLKPLIYGLAFEDGVAHPESLIEDRPAGFSGYVPTNFDREFLGTVTVRRALQLSLNVPAVRLLDAVGPVRLVARMRRAGADPRLPDASPAGLAIGLGGVGLTLRDLVGIYAALARGGRAVDLRENLTPALGERGGGRRSVNGNPPVLDERAAWTVASILRGVPTPSRTRADGIAFKTGTSYGYRDAWAIGFDGRWVAGVWTGRPDGAPVPGLIGIESAAPVLIDVFARLGARVPLRAAPAGTLMASSSAKLPPPLRHAPAGGGEKGAARADQAPEIAYPPSGARIDLGLSGGSGRPLALKVRGGRPPFTWFADGSPIQRQPFAREILWTPGGVGFLDVSVVDGQGHSARARVFLE
ncbi:penicillin-binding protein 1C [Imhoffiella purpurea]|uniref:peptidoglycan glycosyltransferase n=1 Tax=Imhoffiella purpurea TaxID=1249627 RepID=W9V7L5_9GAMM|nr:penicillin-binding protein 1C [Imhoffiella purpurea]EXJ15568.1 Multimodular transpeptidase-transglycosylase [Imhoffiella purpurea]